MEIFHTAGTCSRQIIFRVDEEERVTNIKFVGGCSGNLQGIARLVDGQKIDDVVPKLQGIICRSGTSCPDQLAKALIKYKKKKNGEE
ncbi:MAG: TIGR03905 family TSCPD domain-containing protein [Clostridia bacterium]|nr:TIGR03905 family TSCPD domain-containing protein [Clostridia bacterium]